MGVVVVDLVEYLKFLKENPNGPAHAKPGGWVGTHQVGGGEGG